MSQDSDLELLKLLTHGDDGVPLGHVHGRGLLLSPVEIWLRELKAMAGQVCDKILYETKYSP